MGPCFSTVVVLLLKVIIRLLAVSIVTIVGLLNIIFRLGLHITMWDAFKLMFKPTVQCLPNLIAPVTTY